VSTSGDPWGIVELEPEVRHWLLSLPDEQFGQVMFDIDRLEQQGVHLGEPATRHLQGKLRELRFYINRDLWRISYDMASDRRIVLLTVFRKERPRERTEIERALKAMYECIAQGHTADEDDY
jgi:phage-related protein